jgi:hypothetical protein
MPPITSFRTAGTSFGRGAYVRGCSNGHVMKRTFDQDDIRLMANALDGAWNFLRCQGSEFAHPTKALDTRMMLAQRIMWAARHRGCDQYSELLMSALKGFAGTTELDADVALRREALKRASVPIGL